MFLNPSLQVAAARQQPSSYSPPASSVTPAGETQPDCFVPLLSFEYVGRIEMRWISRRLTSNKLPSSNPQSLIIRRGKLFQRIQFPDRIHEFAVLMHYRINVKNIN